MINKLILGDSIKAMESLAEDPNFKVDAVITDPPYNVSVKKVKNTQTPGNIFYYGEWDLDFDQYKWLKYADALLKPGGSIVMFNSWKNQGEIAKFMEKEYGYAIKDLFTWIKTSSAPRQRDRRYTCNYETAIWLVKPGEKWTFNRQDPGMERPQFMCSTPRGKKRVHPTQKPIKLMEYLIKIHTNKGDMILDPFSGSGSTCLAALNLQRGFIGIDSETEYHNFAVSRIKERIEELKNVR